MRRFLPLLLATAAIVGACGSDESTPDATDVSATASTTPVSAPVDTAPDPTPGTTQTPGTTDTTAVPATEVTAADLAAPGPYAVGVTTRTLPEGGLVEIWYPAAESARGGTASYALRDFLPEGVAALIPEGIDDTMTFDAARDAEVAPDGPYPIVLSSHGAAGYRMVSSRLHSHLASWGMVVAAPDHPSRDLANVLAGTAEGQPAAADQLRSARALLTTLDDDPLLGGSLDNDRVALGGQSAGGGTIAEVAGDDGILGYASYASGLREAVPAVPSLFVAGALDSLIPVETTRAGHDRAPGPSWLWVITDAGHHAATDVCLIGGGGATLPDLADQAGLGDFVDERLRSLATDGCIPPNRPVTEVVPAVDQASTGFYRWVFGIDVEPIGLDGSAVADGVTVSSK